MYCWFQLIDGVTSTLLDDDDDDIDNWLDSWFIGLEASTMSAKVFARQSTRSNGLMPLGWLIDMSRAPYCQLIQWTEHKCVVQYKHGGEAC
jgi:hypothetical protein